MTPRVEVRQWGPAVYAVFVFDAHSSTWGDSVGLEATYWDAVRRGETKLAERVGSCVPATVSGSNRRRVERAYSYQGCRLVTGSAGQSPSQQATTVPEMQSGREPSSGSS